MDTLQSLCGVYNCGGCQFVVSGECPGCLEGNRQLRDTREQVCSILECVESHSIQFCTECSEPSCLLKRTVELICPMRSRFESMRWWAGRMSRALGSKKGAEEAVKIPPRVVSRLRVYLTALASLADEGASSVSSWQLAERVGVNAALIRKDLSRFGEFGTPSFGYQIEFLCQRIRGILGLNAHKSLIWIGAACFGLHAASLGRLEREGCRVAAVLDTDPASVGIRVGGQEVLPMERLTEVVTEAGVRVAVLGVSGAEARALAGKLVGLGVTAILNVSGELLVLPDSVKVCNMDPVGELLELCYYCEK
jgi:redox-sensing transcriptional repressor